MFQLILTNILFLSLGVILWLFIRALPRLEKEEENKSGFLEKWITSELPEKFDSAMNGFILKTFRKLKIYTLKIDNIVGDRLKRIKWNEPSSKPDFSEIISPVAKDENLADNNTDSPAETGNTPDKS